MSDPQAELAFQREITRLALDRIASFDFALAGSGAIRELGLSRRPTEDIDLFTSARSADAFAAAVGALMSELQDHGYEVETKRSSSTFARVRVFKRQAAMMVEIDLAVDWRSHPPIDTDIGPVLHVDDAVGNKVSAVYGRGEARDFLDLDSIRTLDLMTDEDLLAAAAERDLGFDVLRFADQLAASQLIEPSQVRRYGIGVDQLAEIKERLVAWAAVLRASA